HPTRQPGQQRRVAGGAEVRIERQGKLNVFVRNRPADQSERRQHPGQQNEAEERSVAHALDRHVSKDGDHDAASSSSSSIVFANSCSSVERIGLTSHTSTPFATSSAIQRARSPAVSSPSKSTDVGPLSTISPRTPERIAIGRLTAASRQRVVDRICRRKPAMSPAKMTVPLRMTTSSSQISSRSASTCDDRNTVLPRSRRRRSSSLS